MGPETILQIFTFEVSALFTIIIMGLVSVATFIVGIATIVFIRLPILIFHTISSVMPTLLVWFITRLTVLISLLLLAKKLETKFHLINKLKTFVKGAKLSQSLKVKIPLPLTVSKEKSRKKR